MNIDKYKPQILNLNSDFYLLKKADKEYLRQYINTLMYDIIAGIDHQDKPYVISSYEYLVTLVEYAVRQSTPASELRKGKIDFKKLEELIISLLNYYMDELEGDEPFYQKIEKLTGIPEQEMRKSSHKNYWKRLNNAILSVRKDFPDFLKEVCNLEEGNDKLAYLNEMSIQTAVNCLEEDLEQSIYLVRELYENIKNDYFLCAKRRMEIILFRLNVLKYYEVSKRIGEVNHQLFCLQTETGNSYRLDVLIKLEQSFDRKRGREFYENGKKLYEAASYEQAVNDFRESALEGIAEGAFLYGDMLMEGQGCSQDEFTGAFWLWQAANMGSSQATANLGVCYYNGKGVWRSKVRGLHYFALAALLHNSDAVYNIGVSLENEEVIAGNAVMGRTFKRAASELEYSRAANFVDTNAKVIAEITAEALCEREGDII